MMPEAERQQLQKDVLFEEHVLTRELNEHWEKVRRILLRLKGLIFALETTPYEVLDSSVPERQDILQTCQRMARIQAELTAIRERKSKLGL